MRRFAIRIVIVLIMLGLGALYVVPKTSGDWRPRVAFVGFTNSISGNFAVISISNQIDRSIVLMDYEIEYFGIKPSQPVAGYPNLIRRVSTGTNLVIGGLTNADFIFLIPTNGESWRVGLPFAKAGLGKKLRDDLSRRRNRWYEYIPLRIRGYPAPMVSVAFTNNAANQAVQGTGASRLGQ